MPIPLQGTPSLAQWQRYVETLEHERGFAHQSVIEKCLLLGEEVGELFKSVRKASRLATDPASTVSPVSDELADVFIYLCAIANRAGVDLETAVREKEARNAGRTWT
ncbi:MAG: MazG nucleotide pyrophosphohydrolase domain-containing protein [Myxococcota bacterium]